MAFQRTLEDGIVGALVPEILGRISDRHTSRYPIRASIQEGFHHGLCDVRFGVSGLWSFPSIKRQKRLLKQDIMSLLVRPRVLWQVTSMPPEDEYHEKAKLIFEQLDATKSSARNLNHGAIDYGAVRGCFGARLH